jgi:pyruvate dehydrogenase E2 component (dihydrolipoamide acetyltransferase)
MPINILMPALSPTMEEGNLAKWLVKEGDSVTSGDVLAEIETDKATMEVEAVDEGTVGKIVVPDWHEGVKVNELIAVLLEEGERRMRPIGDALPHRAASRMKVPQEPAPGRPIPACKSLPSRPAPADPTPPAPRADGSSASSSPLARRIAKQNAGSIWRRSAAPAHAAVSSRRMSRLPLPVGHRQGAGFGSRSAPSQAAPRRRKGMSDDAVLKNCSRKAPTSWSARRHAQDDCRAPDRNPSRPSRTSMCRWIANWMRCSSLRQRAEQGGAGQRRQAGLQAVGQRHGDQGAGLGPARCADANVSWTASDMVKHKHADVGVAVSIPAG